MGKHIKPKLEQQTRDKPGAGEEEMEDEETYSSCYWSYSLQKTNASRTVSLTLWGAQPCHDRLT